MDAAQLWALAKAAARQLVWGLRAAASEIQHWRCSALRIPNDVIREDALAALARKRTHAHGAALFWILPRRRDFGLLRLLVAYELIWDLLDNLSERAAAAGQTDGRQLHLAIVEAIDPSRAISDYYERHPWRGDGGYLRELVEVCREGCARLPSYPQVRAIALRDAELAQVLALNHDHNQERRDASLRGWADKHFSRERGHPWWELTGAASAPLAIHAMLALAAEPDCSDAEIEAAHRAYFPWLSATTTMLDSYVDQAEDAASGDHSYLAHYPDYSVGVPALVIRSLSEVRALPRGPKHAVIGAAMVAMYLSKSSARAPAMRATTRSIVRAGGTLTRVLLPVLRLWRFVFAQRGV